MTEAFQTLTVNSLRDVCCTGKGEVVWLHLFAYRN